MNFNSTPPSLVSTITCPSTFTVRNICYEPDSNAFWVGGWATDLSLVNMSGTVIRTIPAATHGLTSTYGTAYDTITPGGPFIWAINAASTVGVITQINATTGTPTGLTHACSDVGTAIGGGLWIQPGIVTGTVTLGGLLQNETLFGYNLASVIPDSFDIKMNSLTSPGKYLKNNTTVSLKGEIENVGSETITSFDLNYTVNGGSIITDNIGSVSIPYNTSYNYTHTNTWTPSATGMYDFVIWTSNINGNADADPSNDTVFKTVQVYDTTAFKKVIIEEFTGAWCGYCPEGAYIVDQLLTKHGDTLIAVGNHNGDDMVIAGGTAIQQAFSVTGYPNAMIDRKLFSGQAKETHSRGEWADNVKSQIGSYSPVAVSVEYSYNYATRQITATITADFVEPATGDMRFICEITEDSITGTGSGYNQVNYYNTTAGHPYNGAGNPIIGFVHRHVLIGLPSGAMGNAGVIPSTVAANSQYNENFTFTLPNGSDVTRVSIIGFVAYNSNIIGKREVLNSNEIHLSELTGIIEKDAANQLLSIYPNPTNDVAFIDFNLFDRSNVNVNIYNILGALVYSKDLGSFSKGKNLTAVDVNGLDNGLYIIQLKIGENTLTKKLTIN
ncbi:MAG: Omp28-related outer membrane protein [Bacteroidetes bacterium]|nr:Omp28-related outer membrane protein [Bacteroidota bacterium]